MWQLILRVLRMFGRCVSVQVLFFFSKSSFVVRCSISLGCFSFFGLSVKMPSTFFISTSFLASSFFAI